MSFLRELPWLCPGRNLAARQCHVYQNHFELVMKNIVATKSRHYGIDQCQKLLLYSSTKKLLCLPLDVTIPDVYQVKQL